MVDRERLRNGLTFITMEAVILEILLRNGGMTIVELEKEYLSWHNIKASATGDKVRNVALVMMRRKGLLFVHSKRKPEQVRAGPRNAVYALTEDGVEEARFHRSFLRRLFGTDQEAEVYSHEDEE